ncbi:MAG: hypothetical protein R3B13_14860 [Polyangiaceae bacterium]
MSWVLSGVIAVVAGVFIAVGKRLRQGDIGFHVFVLLVTLLPSVWMGRFTRDIVLSLVVALILSFAGETGTGRLGWASLGGGLLFVLSRFVPGGVSVILLTIALIALVFFAREAWLHRRRLQSTARLDPGTAPTHEVEVGGRVVLHETVELPAGYDVAEVAGYRFLSDKARCAPAFLRMDTDVGPVLIELSTVNIEDATKVLPGKRDDSDASEEATTEDGDPDEAPADEAAASDDSGASEDATTEDEASDEATADEAAADSSTAADKVDIAKSAEENELEFITVIPHDVEAYVIGTPRWGDAPREASGYRRTKLVPVFGDGATLYLKAESEVDARATWHLVLTAGFAAVCAIVAAAHAWASA